MNKLYLNINTCTQHYHYYHYHVQCIIIACITSLIVTIFHSSTVNSANIIPLTSLFLVFSVNIIIVINIFITIIIMIIIITIFIIPTIIIIIILFSLICWLIPTYIYIYSHGLVNSRKQ